ncbi:MAG: UbiD family decarboxylase [Chloroflexi bacterium]|nr:UbiD family decarboxylase [Chloroflexota bacterium]
MASDLRSFLTEVDYLTTRVSREVDPLTQMGTLCSQSPGPIVFEQLTGHPGWRACDRLHSSRELRARALHSEPAEYLRVLAARIAAAPGESRVVKDGKVREKIMTGEEVDLYDLPVGVGSEDDGGRYIASGMCVTKDPDTGVQNTAYYRTLLKDRNRATVAMGHRESWGHLTKNESNGRPTPMAIVIGHHPAYEMAAAYTGPHPGFEEFELTASLLEEPVEFVRCETIDLRVPADAEIVIEGLIPPGVREPEGPYGEYTGYMGPGRAVPVLEATAITMRHDAFYRHLNGSRNADQQALSSLMSEAVLYANLKQVFGASILDVHMPDHAMFTTVVQMTPHYEGQGKAVLMAALGMHRMAKVVMVVDDDIDIFDPKDVMWALSCRVNPATDISTVTGTRGFKFDPSTPDLLIEERLESGKPHLNGVMGIDATKPPVRTPDRRRSFARAVPVGQGQWFLRDFIKA